MKRGKARSAIPRNQKRLSVAKKHGDGAGLGVANHGRTFPVVGIGASAGGLDAFKKFFGAMPADSGMAFVLIQHLDPTRESLTAELVGTYTPMRVLQVRDEMRVERNRVYVIPPNHYLSLREGTLRLSTPTQPRSLRMAVDFFLYSLAADQQEKAIGIILSGTGTDGTLGLREVKSAGGMTMVQDPQTAQHDGMPRSAVANGCTDYILPAETMAQALLAYVRHAPNPEPGGGSESESDPLRSAVALLHARTKLDFSGYKKATLMRRIQRRMSVRHLDHMRAYVDLLHRDPAEIGALFKDLLLKVTSFFRESAAWQALQEQVIRRLVAEKEADAPLRVWVPACATGEEAYSLAMVLIEELQAAGKSCRLQVFASDVDAEALEVARVGLYPEGIAAHVQPERLSRFFVKGEHNYRVNKELRDTVVFAQQSLVSNPPFSRLDVISCRNLLIYLEPAVQERIIALLHFAMVGGGYLFLGSAESIGRHEDLFEVVSRTWRIYRRIGPTRRDKVQFPVVPAAVPRLDRGRPLSPQPGRLAMLAQHLLLQRYVPACVITNRTGEILYFHGRTEDYLTQPTGLPTQDLIAHARNGLRSKLRGALQEATRSNQRVVIRDVPVRRGSESPRVGITVEPLNTTGKIEGVWLVSFEDEPRTVAAVPTATENRGDPAAADAAFVQELETELKATKEDLERSIEDLRAANEELMSANEELQASNEELETSKEELQSLNEELTTANTQLEGKIGELEAANNDLDNLLTSTNIATVFLDTHLRIRRFTPAATKLFSLIPADVGRPIGDIVQKFTDADLFSDAALVLRQPIAPKREVQGNDGRLYVRQVLPYRTREKQIDGVVITLSDVAAEALLEARLYAESIVDTIREPLLVLDADLRICSANRSFYTTFQVREEQTVGKFVYELGNRQWDTLPLRALLAEVLSEKRVLNDFEVVHDFESVGARVMLLNARTLRRGGDRPELILLAIEDVTERKRVQEALRESEARKLAAEQVRQRQAELAHVLRISTINELASGLAHELNQPLSAIANVVEACARYVRSGKGKSSKLLTLLDDAAAEALRAGEIVEHLRGFIQKGTPQFEQTDLREIVRNVPRLLRHEIEQEQITLDLVLLHPLPIVADRIQIEQVVVNLMQNAIDALREGDGNRREIELVARITNGTAEVAVRDTGVGVSAAAAERLFEPFFTTKLKGLGMGLAISRSIIEAHQGRIWAEPPADGTPGTTVRFTLPLRAVKRARGRRAK